MFFVERVKKKVSKLHVDLSGVQLLRRFFVVLVRNNGLLSLCGIKEKWFCSKKILLRHILCSFIG